ncbi:MULTISPECIES: MarR family winged helix-turn-helix transcriptional regulator [Pseudomonadaceae]|uniref:MarR family winged helix-turn-helix transcriptional regulator n=1 Tax=Pseudomonadaceae TaxID=135621 RepID=UPI003002F965
MPATALNEALQRVTHAYRAAMASAIREAEVPLPVTHVRVLKAVGNLPECTAQRIAQRMRRDKAQITRVLNELHASGLINKRDNPTDRRSQLLEPSTAGKAMMQRIKQLEQQTLARMTREINADEVALFIRLAGRMTDNLDAPASDH